MSSSELKSKAAGMGRLLRAVVVLVVCLVTFTSLQGCGATKALVGIHEAPKANTTAAPLTDDRARDILARAFTAAYLAETKPGAAAGAQLRTAYTGEALRAATGRAKLASVQPVAATSPILAPRPRVLAVSRGFGFPRFIVAQSAADGGVPVLHLLTSPNAGTPYRISASVEMVPPAAVKPFDPLSKGSPLVPNGTGPLPEKAAGLAIAPSKLLDLYAAQLSFPAKPTARPPFAGDSFADQVRAAAGGFSKAVATQATFTQTHKVIPSSVYAVKQAGGDGLVFGVLQRTDNVDVLDGQRVKTGANKPFVLLSGKKVVSNKATSTTLEFVVFAVPRSTGKAALVAAREQIVAGSGS